MPKTLRKPSPSPHSDCDSPPRTTPRSSVGAPKSQLDWAICAGLLLVIVAVYAPVGHFAFVTYDDPTYVTENAHVRSGLTTASIGWALTAVVSANWMPVTMLSHLAAYDWFGLNSGLHHRLNEVIHGLAALLLFLTLRRATRALWPSAFVAGIFAVHPLHVESVAWIAERKDVLSALFWFLGTYAYVRYTERPGIRRYLYVLVAFCLGLMSKPILVTFPFTLLLLDFWPLGRLRTPADLPKLAREKSPLFAASLAASVVTYVTQHSAGAVQTLPFATRLANALVWYGGYIGETFWPSGLAVFYPYPQSIPAWQVAGAVVLLMGVSAAAIITWRTRPYLAAGWFWYLGTLVPVIGLVQVGFQSHADRYMYLPIIGLAVMVAWGAADLAQKWPRTKSLVASAAVAAGLACTVASSAQADYWQNTETLYRRALSVTRNNYMAEFNLGDYLMDLPGRGAEGLSHFEASLKIKPDQPEAHNSIGAYYLQNGRDAEAIPQFEEALREDPKLTNAQFNLAMALARIPNRVPEAIAHYEAALRLQPDLAVAHKNLGMLLLQGGRTADALAHFQAAQQIHPDPEITRIMAGLPAAQR